MTFANCPKCGSSNVTTAGVCANCGWTRFHQVMGEIEIKVTGKALLDDYKRLLFENRNLKERIAELEAGINKFIAEGEYLSLLNGIVPGDSNFDKLVEGYFEEREK